MIRNIKFYTKYLIKLTIRALSRILFIFPIRENQIMFSSYYGEKITCNPKAIYDYLSTNYSNKFKYVWVYNGNREDVDLCDNVTLVRRYSLKWFFYFPTSKVIVDNIDPAFVIPKRTGQLYIETWHAGGAYKKVGGAVFQRKVKYGLKKTMEAADVFISSSEGFTRSNIQEGYHFKGDIYNCGMPRNDIFFNTSEILKAKEKIERTYNIKGLTILYAPTFRGGLKHFSDIDEISDVLNIRKLQESLKYKYNSEINILVRCHHWDNHRYSYGENIIDAANYPDMQELLCAADILITDYSSSMWDYALLGRPCLLYVPDVDKYIKDRGFFTSIEQWPGIVCKDMDEVCQTIETLDENECKERARKHLEIMGSYETGHATEAVCNKILDFMN